MSAVPRPGPEVQVRMRKGLFSTAGTQQSLVHVQEFERTTAIQVPAAEKRGDLRSLIRGLSRFLSAARVIGSFEQDLPVSVHQLHCPQVPGATGKLQTVLTRTHGAKCEVKILGIGGSDSAELTFEAADAFETAGRCLELVYGFAAAWEHCEISDADGKWRRFVRLKEVFKSRSTVDIRPVEDDLCLDIPGDKEEEVSIDLTPPESVAITRKLAIRDKNSWSIQSKLDFPAVGLTAGTELRGERKFETNWEYKLPPGFHYVAVRTRNPPTWVWQGRQSTP